MKWLLPATGLLAILTAVVFLRSGREPGSSSGEGSGAVVQVAPEAPHVGSVNREWGFVTLEQVDALNLSEHSEVEVVRDGLILGKLRIASTEGDRAVADIPASGVGREIRAGDLVR